MDLASLLHRSRTSVTSRWWLNVVLRWMIPFNRPHGFVVVPLQGGGIRVDIPYRRINRNHINGIHACCLATAAEFCSGLALMEHLDADRYRIIMKNLRMDYRFQAKAAASATLVLSPELVEEHVLQWLRRGPEVVYAAEVQLCDELGNRIATGRIEWQVKEWDKVRTQV